MIIKNTVDNGDSVKIELTGRLDTVTAPELQEVLIPLFDKAKTVDLDFTDLVYLSSAGLRVLLMGEKTAKAKSATMTINNVSGEIMEVFKMTGFDNVLKIK